MMFGAVLQVAFGVRVLWELTRKTVPIKGLLLYSKQAILQHVKDPNLGIFATLRAQLPEIAARLDLMVGLVLCAFPVVLHLPSITRLAIC